MPIYWKFPGGRCLGNLTNGYRGRFTLTADRSNDNSHLVTFNEDDICFLLYTVSMISEYTLISSYSHDEFQTANNIPNTILLFYTNKLHYGIWYSSITDKFIVHYPVSVVGQNTWRSASRTVHIIFQIYSYHVNTSLIYNMSK